MILYIYIIRLLYSKVIYAFKKTVDIAPNVGQHPQEKTGSRVADSDIVVLPVVTDFNTRNVVNNCTQIFGMSTHAKNKHSQNWERSMSVAPSGYASNLMHMKSLVPMI